MMRTLMGPAVALLMLSACAPDPYSWDDVTCASEIPVTHAEASADAFDRLDALGAEVRFGRSDGHRGAHTAWTHTGDCEVTFFAGWDEVPLDEAAVPWHELVHCRQSHWGDSFTREFPAFRQEGEVARALGYDEDEIANRMAWHLGSRGWYSDENLDRLLEECPE